MNLTPIKLIKNRNVRTTLLNVKEGETAEIDTSDYIERRMNTNVAASASSPARIYAVNYNILRVKNGMAGVAFGN